MITSAQEDNLKFIIAHYGTHPVFHRHTRNGLGAGEPLTIASIKLLIEGINSEELDYEPLNFKGVIPKGVLRFSTQYRELIFCTPPQVKKLKFDQNLPILEHNYPLPTLIWKLEDKSLSIFASKENNIAEITADTKLYQAPFLNTSESGRVCMGSAVITDADSYEEFIFNTKQAFFNSVFTHTNADNLVKGNIVEMYHQQRANNKTSFNNELLIDTKTTVNDIF